MKKDDFLDRLGDIDESFIEEADREEEKEGINVAQIGVLAACVLMAFGIIAFMPKNTTPSEADGTSVVLEELPKLTIGEDMSGMGFEGYMAYDISEIISSEPWNEGMKIKTLPVFDNVLLDDENKFPDPQGNPHVQKLFSDGTLYNDLCKVIEKLGLTPSDFTFRDNSPTEKQKEEIREKYASVGEEVPAGFLAPSCLIAENADYEIRAEGTHEVGIKFKNPVKLPEGLELGYFTPLESIEKTAEYLKTEYTHIIDMENPVTAIDGGDMDIYKRRHYTVSFYEKGATAEEAILNSAFKRVYFTGNEEGDLTFILLDSRDLSSKLGDYPIVSSDEAENLLLEGHFVTSLGGIMPKEENIASCELIYKRSTWLETLMPYYKFLVYVPEMPNLGDVADAKQYAAFYVPAVRSEYIENYPQWDGSIN